MKAHIVEGGRVVNTIEVEALDFMPNLIPADSGGQIGDLWDGEAFNAPLQVVQVPAAVTMRQARLALLAAGLLSGVDAAIASLAEPQKSQALIAWEYSQEVQRQDGLVALLAAALILTAEQIDQLFIQAATL